MSGLPRGMAILAASMSFAVLAVGQDAPPDDQIVEWVQQTVAERQPPSQDKRFDEIAWVTEIQRAIELGKKHNRPIYLFTMDGRINTGRC